MFPQPWYGATFYSTTYWPRPQVRIRDAMLQRFLNVEATVQSVGLAGTPFLAVPARSSSATVAGSTFLAVDQRSRFTLVDS